MRGFSLIKRHSMTPFFDWPQILVPSIFNEAPSHLPGRRLRAVSSNVPRALSDR